MSKHSKENGIFNYEPFDKKLMVFILATPSDTNLAFSIILELFILLRIKPKGFQTIPCSLEKYSFELILNDYFLNILNIKGKTKSWPLCFHNINAFLIKVFFLPIFSNYILNYQCNFVFHLLQIFRRGFMCLDCNTFLECKVR